MSGKVGDTMREALAWALPLAEIALEAHRLERVKAGHHDIQAVHKNGETWIGLYQSEYDAIESARTALSASPQDGWVLVPREPTQAMIDAATESLTGIGAGADHDYDDDARSMYAAFIRTLPQPTGDGT